MQEQVTQTTEAKIKLNLGGGINPLEGYLNWDRSNGHEAYPLPVADCSIDEIRASHILEHFPAAMTAQVIADWVRALKPGGLLKISVPDFDSIVDRYRAPGDNGPIESWVMGGHTDANDQHHAIFNFPKLCQLLRAANLWRVEGWKSTDKDCSALPISLNVCGVKPTVCEKMKLHFVMSAPRYGFTMFQQSLAAAVQRFPESHLHIVTGAYWSQCMERGIVQALDQGATHVMTLDYDSVFTYADVLEMTYLARSYPEAQAIFPLQAARGWDAPLFCRRGKDGKNETQYSCEEFSQNLVPMESGHFGLTIMDAACLKKMKHPWLQCVPNEAGVWEDGKLDADIGFWRKLHDAGGKLYLAPHVVIGHIAEVVLWPNDKLSIQTQPSSEYNKTGRPAWTWK